MKRNNVAKRFGIATLCLATAISAFSGIMSFATSNVAVADGTTVATENFVTATGATVAQEEVAVSTLSYTGLHISSDTTYSAELNTVFSGDTVFKFRFPEYKSSKIAGDFKFRITDVNDDSNYFDLVYYVIASGTSRANNGTGVYVQYGDQIRTVNGNGGAWSNKKLTSCTGTKYTGLVPYFNSLGGAYNNNECKFREGTLSLTWTDDVLAVTVPDGLRNIYSETRTVAEFDGTYDTTAETGANGYVASTSWGLPKVSFPSGYKVSISSSYSTGTDVLFSSITTGGVTYDFTQTTVTKDNQMKAYDEITAEENAGKTLLGWKDDTSFYSTAAALTSADISAYTPVFLGFDTMTGASIRIDPTGGQSGLRFMALFDKNDYATAAPYIQSQGTLIAYTSALTKGRFDTVNYATEIAAKTTIAQVPNTKSKMFNYNVETNRVDDVNGQPAYSMALTGITDFTQTYSARGYLVVQYTDESTQIIYTNYYEADNARSIQEVAQLLQQTADYQNYTGEQKAVVDGYAGGAPETQE